jgi:hypothetical protein
VTPSTLVTGNSSELGNAAHCLAEPAVLLNSVIEFVGEILDFAGKDSWVKCEPNIS